jgi:hydroxylaminobenzene mutase
MAEPRPNPIVERSALASQQDDGVTLKRREDVFDQRAQRGLLNADASAGLQRSLALAGAVLMFLGLLTGFYISAAMGQRIHVEVHAAVAAHLNAMLGALWMFAVAWSLPLLRYGEVGRRRLVVAVSIPNYANWLITTVKATLHVSGVDVSPDPANNVVMGALTLLVVLPALAACGVWVLGFRKPRS